MNLPPLELSTETMVDAIIDQAEQNQNLDHVKANLNRMEESLRNMVSPEAWELIMRYEEETARFRYELVKNVLVALGVPF